MKVYPDPLGLLDHREREVHKDHLASLVVLDLQVLRDHKDLVEILVLEENQDKGVSLDQLVHKVRGVSQAGQDHRGLLVLKDLKDLKVTEESPDHQVPLVCPAHQVNLCQEEREESQGHQVLLAQEVRKEPGGSQVLGVNQEHLVILDNLDLLGREEREVSLGHQVYQDNLDQQDLEESLAARDQEENQAKGGNQEVLVNKVWHYFNMINIRC